MCCRCGGEDLLLPNDDLFMDRYTNVSYNVLDELLLLLLLLSLLCYYYYYYYYYIHY